MTTAAPTFSPYAACKQVNAALLEDGITKILPPQMFYNYTTARIRAGKTPMIPCDVQGRITAEGLADWYSKYSAKLTTTSAK
jgi:hypothetical protein